jgi:hypothetical protein
MKKAGCILLIFKAQYSSIRDLEFFGIVFLNDLFSGLNFSKNAMMPLHVSLPMISFTRPIKGLPLCKDKIMSATNRVFLSTHKTDSV